MPTKKKTSSSATGSAARTPGRPATTPPRMPTAPLVESGVKGGTATATPSQTTGYTGQAPLGIAQGLDLGNTVNQQAQALQQAQAQFNHLGQLCGMASIYLETGQLREFGDVQQIIVNDFNALQQVHQKWLGQRQTAGRS